MFLDQQCGANQDLRAAVERLLAQHDASPPTGLFEEPTKQAPVQTLAEGTLLSNRFRIVRFVGRGGMGEVYKATDHDLGGDVALKILLPELVDDRQFLLRFRREVQIARQVTHPNVCRIFDVGRDQHNGRELVFLTMEFLDGVTLSSYLRRNGRMPIDEAMPVLRQIADGLGALHDKQIIHRDFKPGNVMIVSSPNGKRRAVIGDFGLARPVEGSVPWDKQDETLSRPGHFYGTFGYMSPEQLRAKPLTTAADIYAFGLVMYELVSGKRLFPAGVTLEDAVQRVNEEAQLPADHGLPEEWQDAIMQCLAIDPARRPPSASAALAIVSGTVIAAPRSSETRVARTEVRPAPGNRKRLVWIAAPVVIALLALLIPAVRERILPDTQSSSVRSEMERALKLMAKYYRPKDLAESIALLEKVVAADPNSARAHYELGRAYWQSYIINGKDEVLVHARKALERAVDLNPSLAGPHVSLANIYIEQGIHDNASNELQQALKLDARNAEAYQALAQLYRKQGRDSEALPALQKAVDLNPTSWSPHTALGNFYRDTGKLQESTAELETAAKLAPDNPGTLNNLGLAYLRQNRFSEASASLQKAIQLEPNYQRAVTSLGNVLMLEGKYAEAAEMYKKAIELNPSSYGNWGALASAYAWSGVNKDKALEAYQKAIDLAEQARQIRPKSAQLLGYLGSLYATVGKADMSLPLIRQALALEPESADAAIRAAEAYEALHMRDDAVRWLSKAIDLRYSKEVIKRSPELAGLRSDPRLKGKLQ